MCIRDSRIALLKLDRLEKSYVLTVTKKMGFREFVPSKGHPARDTRSRHSVPEEAALRRHVRPRSHDRG